MTEIDWTNELLDQLRWHWDNQLRPKLDGISDEEYVWEPVSGCWNLRRKDESTAPIVAGAGELGLEFAMPQPDPAPVTTIAWRLGHLILVFGQRNASHFGGPPMDYVTVDWPASASGAIQMLDEAYARWTAGVLGLGADGLARAVGSAEGLFAEKSYAALALHINREVIHHGAEIALLRDLYRVRETTP